MVLSGILNNSVHSSQSHCLTPQYTILDCMSDVKRQGTLDPLKQFVSVYIVIHNYDWIHFIPLRFFSFYICLGFSRTDLLNINVYNVKLSVLSLKCTDIITDSMCSIASSLVTRITYVFTVKYCRIALQNIDGRSAG